MEENNIQLCPACGLQMLSNEEGKAKNPKAPDYKCQDRNCRFTKNKETGEYTVPSKFITSVWETDELPEKPAVRKTAMKRFENSLETDKKEDSISQLNAKNNALLLAAHGIIDINEWQDWADTIHSYTPKRLR